MKKTFVSPVAQIVAAEAQNIIAASTIPVNGTPVSGKTNDARSNNGSAVPSAAAASDDISAMKLN